MEDVKGLTKGYGGADLSEGESLFPHPGDMTLTSQ